MTRKITYTCEYCKKTVTKRVDTIRFNNRKHHFCSTKCYYQYKREHPWEYRNITYDTIRKLNRLAKNLNGISKKGFRIHLKDNQDKI